MPAPTELTVVYNELSFGQTPLSELSAAQTKPIVATISREILHPDKPEQTSLKLPALPKYGDRINTIHSLVSLSGLEDPAAETIPEHLDDVRKTATMLSAIRRVAGFFQDPKMREDIAGLVTCPEFGCIEGVDLNQSKVTLPLITTWESKDAYHGFMANQHRELQADLLKHLAENGMRFESAESVDFTLVEPGLIAQLTDPATQSAGESAAKQTAKFLMADSHK